MEKKYKNAIGLTFIQMVANEMNNTTERQAEKRALPAIRQMVRKKLGIIISDRNIQLYAEQAINNLS